MTESTRDRLAKAAWATAIDQAVEDGSITEAERHEWTWEQDEGMHGHWYAVIDAILSELEKPSDAVVEVGCGEAWDSFDLRHTKHKFQAMIAAIREGK